jgi:hypothetical protein
MVWAIGSPAQQAAMKELIEHRQSDRVTAVIGGAILEDALKDALINRFRSSAGHNTNINKKIFRPGGPLGYLNPKIDLAYQLYVFEKPIRNAMYGIADIRNTFAHQLDLTFDSAEQRMVDAVDKLTLHQGRTHYPNPLSWNQHLSMTIEPINTARDKFLVNFADLSTLARGR